MKTELVFERFKNVGRHTEVIFIKRPAFKHKTDARHDSPESVFLLDPQEALHVILELQKFRREVNSIEARSRQTSANG